LAALESESIDRDVHRLPPVGPVRVGPEGMCQPDQIGGAPTPCTVVSVPEALSGVGSGNSDRTSSEKYGGPADEPEAQSQTAAGGARPRPRRGKECTG
jgi:hypothetical protein